MSRTSLKERNKAIRKAWEKEQLLVQEGKGTRDWTSEQQKDILDPTKGKAYDDQGRAFEGQHMKSAAEYPEEQGNPDNIQFLTRDEHLEAHKGSWQNPTNWYYDPVTKEFFDFGEGPVIPCNIIILSDPLCIPVIESSINISEETTITEEESENSAPHLAGDSNKSSVKETNPSRSKQILIIYYDVAIIAEVKAGSFIYTAPLVDYENHIQSYKKLIEDPGLQCKRTYDYLLANDTSIFYTENGIEKATIETSSLSDVYMLSVTVDNINEFASKAEKLSFLNLQCPAISISVDDLMIYAHYFESPLTFLHFLKQRRAATTVPNLATYDELDHLGLYIKYNCYHMNFEDKNHYSPISVIGFREDLDDYFEKLYHPELTPSKPKQELPSFIESIIIFLEKSNIFNKVLISNYILDFSQDAKENLCNRIEYALQRQRELHASLVLGSAGQHPRELRYTCFINQQGVAFTSSTEQVKYVLSTMLWNSEENRALLCLELDSADKISNVAFHLYKKQEIPPDQVDELMTQGRERAAQRIKAYKKKHGPKIGRNEDCPCGSGKKYKRCCGRNT